MHRFHPLTTLDASTSRNLGGRRDDSRHHAEMARCRHSRLPRSVDASPDRERAVWAFLLSFGRDAASMKCPRQQPTRSAAIFAATQEYLHETGRAFEAFAVDVVERYHTRVTELHRSVKFATGGNAYDDMRANAQKLRRYMDPDVNARLPVDLEEAWILGIGRSRRNDLICALASRLDRVSAPMPAPGLSGELQNVCDLMRETGQVFESLAPILADGVIDADDAPHVEKAISEIDQAIGELISWRVRLAGVGKE